MADPTEEEFEWHPVAAVVFAFFLLAAVGYAVFAILLVTGLLR